MENKLIYFLSLFLFIVYCFGKRNIMTINYTRYLALPKTWIDAMRLEKGDRVEIEMDNENRLVITPAKERGALPDMNLKPDSERMFVKVQYVSNGSTQIFCIFIAAGESDIPSSVLYFHINFPLFAFRQ